MTLASGTLVAVDASFFEIENTRHGSGYLAPSAGLLGQVLRLVVRQRVEARLAIVLGHAPLGADPFLRFQPLYSGQSSVIYQRTSSEFN